MGARCDGALQYVLGFIVWAARRRKRLKGSPVPQLQPFTACQSPRRSSAHEAILEARRSAAACPLDWRVTEARTSRLSRSAGQRRILCGNRIRGTLIQVARIKPYAVSTLGP